MEVVLVMFKADGAMRSFPLKRETTVIGRREDCDLRIPLTEVSRKHCRLVKDGDHLRLEDLGSSNGTYHNGSRVQETVLQPGDVLQVGPVVFTVQIAGFPPASEIRPPQAIPTVNDSVSGSQVSLSPFPASAANTFGRGSSAMAGRPASPEGPDLSATSGDSGQPAASSDDIDDILGLSPEKEK